MTRLLESKGEKLKTDSDSWLFPCFRQQLYVGVQFERSSRDAVRLEKSTFYLPTLRTASLLENSFFSLISKIQTDMFND